MEKGLQYQPPIIVVVDIGGSKYMPGFVDRSGNILYQERREWEGVTPDDIVRQLKAAIHEICDAHPMLAREMKAGGLTIPGFADPVEGVWVDSDFLIVKDLPICEILSEEFGIPFFADNDGNACALAEKYFGGAADKKDFLYMTVSTGIGGALYLNEELYYGAFWHAGEIGLFVVEEYGRPSDTGSVNGIAEMYASGRGFAENYIEAGGASEIGGRKPGGPEISKRAEEGDAAAQNALRLEGRCLGRMIANACTFAGFEKIILGGGLSLLFHQYQDALLEEFHRILPGRTLEIEATALGYSGAFLGAAAVGIRGLEGFRGSRGSGNAQENILQVRIGDTVEASLILEGSVYENPTAGFGEFLAAKQIGDDGMSLNQILRKYRNNPGEECYACIGNCIGKALACACVLLDPGKVRIEGNYVDEKVFQENLHETLVRETYYRGKLPFSMEYHKL